MAGKGAAGALLLAGVMMSTGAMAASGDPVTGGSGTVAINVPIVTSTCSVSAPTSVSFDPIGRNQIIPGERGMILGLANNLITKTTFNMTFTNCQGILMRVDIRYPDHEHPGYYIAPQGMFYSGDPDHALRYDIELPSIPGVIVGGSIMDLFGFTYLTPDSDNFIFSPTIKLLSNGISVDNLGTQLIGAFEYILTYK